MTVMIPKFFGIDPSIMRSGRWAKMNASQVKLYGYLMHESEGRRTRQFKAKDSETAKVAGVAPRSLCDARKKLQEWGLIRYEAGVGNIYVYTICDPETCLPYLGNPDVPVRYAKQSDNPAPEKTALQTPTTPRLESPKPDQPLESYGLPGLFDRQSSNFR